MASVEVQLWDCESQTELILSEENLFINILFSNSVKVDVKSPTIATPDDRSQYLLPAFLCDFNWLIRTQELVWAKALLASEG